MQRSKYKPGDRIKSLQEMMNQDVIFARGKPVNKGFFQNWSLHYAEQQIRFGLVFEAIKIESGGI